MVIKIKVNILFPLKNLVLNNMYRSRSILLAVTLADYNELHSTQRSLVLVAKMISDDELYSLAIFLGSAAMLMIVLYHFLEANSVEDVDAKTSAPVAVASGSKAKSAIQ